MANTNSLPLDDQGNVDFTPMHKLMVKRTGKQIMRLQMGIRITAVIVLALFLIVLLLYLFSLFSTNGIGRFTVSSADGERGLILSEMEDFSEYTAMLHGDPYEKMDNITYSWMPTDLHEYQGGSHNGKNYFAYTFYVKNTGTEDIDYRAYIKIEHMKLAVDEAVRVQVYKNGESTVYAKQTKDGQVQIDPEFTTTPFVDTVTICDFDREGFVVDEVDKYTIVCWLEGEDPECVNDILGGELKMSMTFDVYDEDEAASV